MSKVFLISDFHWGHANILTYANRPFSNINDMDEFIIELFNKVVSKHDKTYILGDLSFYGDNKTKQLLDRLNGACSLVLGNHDRKSISEYYRIGFKEVYKHPVLYAETYILSHEPIKYCTHPFINIHAHTHGMPSGRDKNLWFDVSVEAVNYTPVLFSKCGSVKFFESYQKIILDK